ncbi:MAG TPA: aldolase/citrate lyase family protein [Candidatus Polarisedimenticolia bacterium]|jgi:citrate lyase subunit beta/citryl-CoA lyase|nr:aldolase/citrate lyase family protein [Candidatus Polarisedimenticolia bacterium]
MPRSGNPGSGATRKGEAGRRGADVRSDLYVALEIRDQGGIDLQLRSKVEPYYGDSIRAQVGTLLDRLGIANARVEIDDTGALPFTIDARLEAAALRAGIPHPKKISPGRLAPTGAASPRDRLRRSRLYLPGNEPKFMINAGLHGADGIILDLEDSVHPSEKDAARQLVRRALRSVDFGDAERMVRINPLPLGAEDLEAIVPEGPDLLLLPKVESSEEVRDIDGRVKEILRRSGSSRPLHLMPILETALGVESAFEIARAADSVVALTLGLEDYTADLGVVKTVEGEETLYARQRVVVAAKAAGLQAIDSVFGDVGDSEGLALWAARSRAMGFEGMGCVHPRQIEIIHRSYAPSSQEIEKALHIEAAFREAEAKGLGVVSLGSKMIDPPVVLRARRLVDRARAMGLIPSEASVAIEAAAATAAEAEVKR